MIKKIFAGIFLIFSIALIGANLFSYNDTITHPDITLKTIEIYKSDFDGKLTNEQKEFIKKGSINEDTFPRYLNYFYNPETKTGLDSTEFNVKVNGMSAKDWAFEQNSASGDYSIPKILENYKYGETQRAYEGIGHIMHLVQDMAVPAHTRNDPHGNGDPYEKWVKENGKVNNASVNAILDISIERVFDELALYSHNNFFSIESIDVDKIKFFYTKIEPGPEKELVEYGYLNGYKLVRIKRYVAKTEYSIDEFVHSDYWRMLSPQAVKYSLVILDYFAKEFEKIDKEKEAQPLSFLDRIKFTISNVDNRIAYAWGDQAKKIELNIIDPALSAKQRLAKAIGFQQAGPVQIPPENVEHSVFNISPDSSEEERLVLTPSIEVASPTPVQNQEESVMSDVIIPVSATAVELVEPVKSVEPVKPYPGETPKIQISQIYLGFGGGGGGGGGNGGSTAVSQPEPESEPDPEPEPEPEPEKDTTPPDVSFMISECSDSVSSGSCLLISQSSKQLNLEWSSTAVDLSHFIFEQNNILSEINSTSTTIDAQKDSINSFGISACDIAGNCSATSTLAVEISSMPVVINEIAWAGTDASAYDEWIELYNRTSKNINLENWILYAQDGKPYIELSGEIKANDYYLLERKDDETVSDIPADLIYGNDGADWALNNDGEVLILSYASTTIDKTAVESNGKWPYGKKNVTMEKNNPDLAGDNRENWYINNEVIKNGKNSDGSLVSGTPKARNSYTYLIEGGRTRISYDVTLTKSGSPYLVNNQDQVFEKGSTLNIESGTVIKFYNASGLIFEDAGKINAKGTSEEPVIFTSFYDDGGAVLPAPGNWYGIQILSDGSVLDNVSIRYAGKDRTSKWAADRPRANIFIKNSNASISNSRIEYGEFYGIRLENSDSSISNNVFKNNNGAETKSSGIFMESGSAPVIESNIFENNRTGIYSEYSFPEINDNSFSGNIEYPILLGAGIGSLSGNSGSGNGTDGILIGSNLTGVSATTTLVANPLPYILSSNARVASGSALVIEAGSIFKGYVGDNLNSSGTLYVDGNLVINGQNSGDIIFESATSTPARGNWGGVRLNKGSTSSIKGATFKYTDTALTYEDSLINLSNVKFENNNLAIKIDDKSVIQTLESTTIEFLDNLATTTPEGLW